MERAVDEEARQRANQNRIDRIFRRHFSDVPPQYAGFVGDLLSDYHDFVADMSAARDEELLNLRGLITMAVVDRAYEDPRTRPVTLSQAWLGTEAMMYRRNILQRDTYLTRLVVGCYCAFVVFPRFLLARLPGLFWLTPWFWMLTTRALLLYYWRQSEMAARRRVLRKLTITLGRISPEAADKIMKKMVMLCNDTPELLWTVTFLLQTFCVWIWEC